ncbi:MAG: hypothetical protein Q9205_000349 [Flavoplaca limonia]
MEIYSLLLDSSDTPPSSHGETGLRYKEAVADRVFHNRNIFYPPPAIYREPILALSHSNGQIRQEIVKSIASACLTKCETCELDVMLRGCMLWPTWTKPPISTAKVEYMAVNLRLFDVTRGGGLFWGNGGPGLTFVVLFRLLNRLLHHGPRFLYKDGESQSFEIQTLVLNVLPGYGKVPCPDDEYFKNQDDPVVTCKQYVEEEYRRIYQHICGNIHMVIHQGLLSGKIQTLKVCHGDTVRVYSTDGIKPNDTPSTEWESYGFVWGINERMKVEKIDCQTDLKSLDHLGMEENKDEEEHVEGKIQRKEAKEDRKIPKGHA